MGAALVASPSTYFLALIIGLGVALPRLGHRAWQLGPMALAAVAMYVISTGIVTSYHYVPGDMQVRWWTVSLLLVGVCYLAILGVRGVRNEFMVLCVVWTFAMFAGATMSDEPMLQKLFWLLQFAGIAGVAFFCFLTVAHDDLMGNLTWAVLFIAEGISAVQIVDCQFLHGMIGEPISEGSACAQVYGWSGAPYLPMALPTLFLIWILARWFNPRKQ